MVKERLRAWAMKLGDGQKLPSNILYYRDGVSQSQYDSLLDKEFPGDKQKKLPPKDAGEYEAILAAYKELCTEFVGAATPKVTLIVVGKRHNTRFFPADASQKLIKPDNGNLKPGYLIQSGVTLVNEGNILHNFFLQSHKAIKGTARTAHYVVLRNGMALDPTEIHEIVSFHIRAFVMGRQY